MLNNPFYHRTLSNLIIGFGTLFSNIKIDIEDSNNVIYETISVPINFVQKEKFIARINNYSSIDEPELKIAYTLPRMGFELGAPLYAPDRKTNTMHRITNNSADNPMYMYNRTPYDVPISLNIATRKLDDSFRIIEQILPYFTPEFNIEIIDHSDFNISSNVPIILESISSDIQYDSNFDDRRTILWELTFTAKTYFYAPKQESSLIKKVYVDFNNKDNNQFLEGLTTYINPLTANPDDDHEIISISRNYPKFSDIYSIYNGDNLNVDLSN